MASSKTTMFLSFQIAQIRLRGGEVAQKNLIRREAHLTPVYKWVVIKWVEFGG